MTEFRDVDLSELVIRDGDATTVTWQGHEALRLANGLAIADGDPAQDLSIEVMIGVDGPAYAGVAFRVQDVANYELAYAQPHTSGRWDALQYDPVFHRSNTWQVYHGPGYQSTADVPTGRWFKLRVDYSGPRAAISLDGQPPLVIERLAHPTRLGRYGLWAYLPAHFRDLRVAPCEGLGDVVGALPTAPPGSIQAWFVEAYGVVTCEPNGILNLNRTLPLMVQKAHLVRRFELAAEAPVALDFGFSDDLTLDIDGQAVFAGTNTYATSPNWADRGYIALGGHAVQQVLSAGRHTLAATLQVTEGFGWGLAMAVHADGIRWLPADLG